MSSDPIDATLFANLVEMTGGELEFVDELVDTFLEDGRVQIEAMRDSLAAADVERLGRAAHSLKSGCLNVGAMDLGARCRALEEAARGGSVPDAEALIAAIGEGFALAGAALLGARAARTSA